MICEGQRYWWSPRAYRRATYEKPSPAFKAECTVHMPHAICNCPGILSTVGRRGVECMHLPAKCTSKGGTAQEDSDTRSSFFSTIPEAVMCEPRT